MIAAASAITPATPPRSPLWGDARPGDTIALVGGNVVRDDNDNGLVDRTDTLLRGRRLPRPAVHVDVRV